MSFVGVAVYLLAFALSAVMWRRTGRLPMEELFERAEAEHAHLHRINIKHPAGGVWAQYRKRVEAEAKH